MPVVLLAAACGGDDDGQSKKPAPLAAACTSDEDCESSLVCAFLRCHTACERDGDCSEDARCVRAAQQHVCQLEDDMMCSDDFDCQGKQVCGVDRECRDPCERDDDCTSGQVCARSGECASTDPDRDMLDEDGNIVSLADAGRPIPDAGRSDGGGMTDGGTSGGEPVEHRLSNLDPDQLPPAPAADLQIAQQCRFDTDDGRLISCDSRLAEAFVFETIEPPDGGSRLAVMRVRSLLIDQAGMLTVIGSLPLVVVADETIRIHGRISVASAKSEARAGGFPGSNGPGAGVLGVSGQFHPSSGGSYCGRGGQGAAPDGEATVEGGPAYGASELSPLLGGSGGGGTSGGAGGGALQLVAAEQILVGPTGVIDAGGGGGGNGSGGGGSGGAILLEAASVRIQGVLAANGGGGGASTGGSGGQDGGPNATPAPGQIAGLGGLGSAGTEIDGQDGMFETQNRALGGGGGAGRIRINTADGEADITGTLSPARTTECVTLGMLP